MHWFFLSVGRKIHGFMVFSSVLELGNDCVFIVTGVNNIFIYASREFGEEKSICMGSFFFSAEEYDQLKQIFFVFQST